MTSPLQIAQPHQHDINHVESILKEFPSRWAFGFARRYNNIKNKQGRREANLYLIDKQDAIKQHPIGLGASDEDIINSAKAKAKKYKHWISGEITSERQQTMPYWYRASFRDGVIDYRQVFNLIKAEIEPLGVIPPAEKKGADYQALCRRFADVSWWRRSLRVAIGRYVEHEAIKVGMVGFNSAYVSNETMQRRREQNKRNAQLLEWIEAENDEGYKSTLAELSAAGVSNPENRKNELMTRIRGIEEEAIRKGLICEFLTLTCPSKYHATSNKRINPKYNNSTPKEAQDYLVNVYAKIRAKLGRIGISPVGFRVAEPHKDACPHWHLMLFVKRSEVKTLRQVFRHYAMQEDGKEAGAYQHRFKAVSIDPNKGSAAGYIAKYIAKNINMKGVEDFDRDGKSAADGLERSVAWAALWGIRQFQEQGNNQITIWREMRRIREGEDLPEVVAVLWKAADAGEYGHFIREAKKRQISLIRETEKINPLYGRAIKPNEKGLFVEAYEVVSELVTGFVNRYGEETKAPIKGVLIDAVELITRTASWIFSYKPRSGLLGLV
jgi:hypothetical protein